MDVVNDHQEFRQILKEFKFSKLLEDPSSGWRVENHVASKIPELNYLHALYSKFYQSQVAYGIEYPTSAERRTLREQLKERLSQIEENVTIELRSEFFADYESETEEEYDQEYGEECWQREFEDICSRLSLPKHEFSLLHHRRETPWFTDMHIFDAPLYLAWLGGRKLDLIDNVKKDISAAIYLYPKNPEYHPDSYISEMNELLGKVYDSNFTPSATKASLKKVRSQLGCNHDVVWTAFFGDAITEQDFHDTFQALSDFVAEIDLYSENFLCIGAIGSNPYVTNCLINQACIKHRINDVLLDEDFQEKVLARLRQTVTPSDRESLYRDHQELCKIVENNPGHYRGMHSPSDVVFYMEQYEEIQFYNDTAAYEKMLPTHDMRVKFADQLRLSLRAFEDFKEEEFGPLMMAMGERPENVGEQYLEKHQQKIQRQTLLAESLQNKREYYLASLQAKRKGS